jgi:hypothetical protein
MQSLKSSLYPYSLLCLRLKKMKIHLSNVLRKYATFEILLAVIFFDSY